MNVDIDQSGRNVQTGDIDRLQGERRIDMLLDGRDPAILNSDITDGVDPIFGIDDASPCNSKS